MYESVPILTRNQLEILTHLSYHTLLDEYEKEKIEIEDFIGQYESQLITESSKLPDKIDFNDFINVQEH